MPACHTLPCARTKRPTGRLRQRGAALLLALLAMSLVAMIAAAALADLGDGIERHSGRHDQAQARQLALGAIDWARNTLAQDYRDNSTDHGGEQWAIRIPSTPIGSDIDSGTVGGQIDDLSGRFNLNTLAPDGLPDTQAMALFSSLLEHLGEAVPEAERLASALTRHLARSPGSASGKTLIVVDELKSLDILNTEQIERIRPFVTALPTPTRININTASAELIAALAPGLGIDRARMLVAERERVWFRDLADFRARLPQEVSAPGADRIDVRSQHFLITVFTRYGVAVTRLEALVDRAERWPTLLWYRQV